MRIYALLTGKGNSTLKDKNVLDVLGHPVRFYPAKAVCESHLITEKFCSSDDDRILYEAQKMSHIPIKRPKELAQPNSQHIDCILHALSIIQCTKELPEILVVTLANNVSIKTKWIDDCIQKMIDDASLTAVVPVYKDNDHHPLRAKTVGKNGLLQPYENNDNSFISTNRQDLPQCLFLAHNFWVLRTENVLKKTDQGQPPWRFMGDRIAYYLIDGSVDIHQEIDLYIAREWVRKNIQNE